MTFVQILKRDLLFYRRPNLTMILLAAVCCAILTGAKLVGDSVRHTLRQIAEMRLGQRTRFAMSTGDHFFRQSLSDEIAGNTETNVGFVPVLAVKGILETPDGSIRVNNLNVYGVKSPFWQFAGPIGQTFSSRPVRGVNISESVKARLNGTEGEFLLRIQQSTVLSQDLIFSTEGGDSQAWEIKIADVIPDEAMGRFDIQASQEPPLNVFVPIDWLAEKIDQPQKANLLLVADGWSSQDDLESRLKECVMPEDLEVDIRRIETEDVFELRSSRIFLDEPIVDAAMQSGRGAYGVFTYFVNEIRCGEKSVPYSTVSALGSNDGQGLFADLRTDEIIINEWLADELNANPGDVIQLTYYQLTPTRILVEQQADFTVRQVVPMMGTFADPTLMPDYPGLTEADSCRDWEAGIPIDLNKIQSEDEDYWDRYKGTPKAFISMKAAQTIWSNRFGTLTAIRWPTTDNTLGAVQADLMKHLDLSRLGFRFEDVRSAAESKASGSTDFAGLFAGLSMFLIFSAAILLALMFVYYIESRTEQAGLLLAIGWNRVRIGMLFLTEGACLASVGCILGAVISVVYTYTLIFILNATFWAGALASLQLRFHADLLTLFKGIVVSFLICLFAIQTALFRRLRRSVHELFTGIFEKQVGRSKKVRLLSRLGVLSLAAGVGVFFVPGAAQARAALFFIAGTLWLIGLILIMAWLLKRLRYRKTFFVDSLSTLAFKTIPRRTGRSLTVMIALACGVFMVIGVGANYKEVRAEAVRRDSGTGGFALMAQTTLPVTQLSELSIAATDEIPEITTEMFVPMRLHEQDDASCLNLNKARQPSLLGVRPKDLAARDAFTFQQTTSSSEGLDRWELLKMHIDEHTIPAIGDYATVYWGLDKKLNDTIPYQAQNGETVELKIVGILKDSVLQGCLLISEDNLISLFPTIDGYRQFLIDANWQKNEPQAKQLMKKYRDYGMEVISTRDKLMQFHEVENTYLAIFLMLGGLGLILGSAGLGLVLVLNVIDRKGELAMMQAVGFQIPSLKHMLFIEHGLLLLAGLVCGTIPALWAVFPSLMTRGMAFPYIQIGFIILAILVSGGLWIRFALKAVLKTDFLDVLKNE